MESEEQRRGTQQNRHRVRGAENKVMVATGERAAGLGRRGKGVKQQWVVVQLSGGIKCSAGNRVNNSVMTAYGARWTLDTEGITSEVT